MKIHEYLGISEELNNEGERIQKALEQSQKEVEDLSRKAPTANAAFKQKFAIAMVNLVDDGKFKTVQMKEAKAQAECAVEYLDYKLQDALLDAAKSAVFTYKALLNAWQTKCGNLKAESEATRANTGSPQPRWSGERF